MKFLDATYTNLGPFESASLKLADAGLVLIQGDNTVTASADSNGSGKSFLLEGLVWCLFGKTIRYDLNKKQTGDSIVRRGHKDCSAVVRIDHAGQVITVERYRKHKVHKNAVRLLVDGADHTKGTNDETDKAICDLLGLDFQTFVRSIYFDGGNIVAFPTLTDAEIKTIFERVLNLEDLQKAAELVKKRRTLASGEAQGIEREISFVESEVSTADVEIMAAQSKHERFALDLVNAVADRHVKITELQSAPLPDPAALDAQEAALNAEETGLNAKLADFAVLDSLVAKANADKAERTGMLATAQAALRAAQTRLAGIGTITPPAELQTRLVSVNHALALAEQKKNQAAATMGNASAKIGSPCGECGKTYEAGDLQAIIDHATRHHAAAEEEIRDRSGEQATIYHQIDVWRAGEATAIEAEIAKVEGDVKMRQVEVDNAGRELESYAALAQKREELRATLAGLPAKRASIADLRRQRQTVANTIETLTAEIAEIRSRANPYEEDIERWKKRREDAADKVRKLTVDLAVKRRQIDMLAVLDRAYGRTGLKAHILETVTPVLNERANDYANRLSDGSVHIEFSTVTKNKDGSLAEKFSVNVVNDQGAEGYLGNSSGEKRKIDLSIALALSDLVAARAGKPIDLWVADEITENLDSTALDRVVDLLRHKASERGSVVVISHLDDLKSAIPNVITVRKRAGGSELAA